MSSATIHFPPKADIVAYLEKHPLTNDLYLREKNIIDVVAGVFANQNKAPMGVDMGVMLSLNDLNEKLDLPEVNLMTIQINLTAALKDCANGNPIEVEKKGK